MKKISFDQVINYLIIGFAFTAPISIAGVVFFSHLIILAFLFKGTFTGAWTEIKKSKIIITLLFFILLSLISVAWSSDKVFALLYIKKYYHLLVIPIIYLTFNIKYIPHVLTSFLLAMLLSIVLSFGIFFELIYFDNVRIHAGDPSPFINHADYSLFLAMASMILLNRMFFTKLYRYKFFYIFFFFISTANLFINAGRTGQVVFIASLFIILFYNIKSKFKALSIAFILSIGIVTVAFNTSSVFKARTGGAYDDISKALMHNDYSGSFGQRLSFWIIGANIFKENTLLGTGIGDEKTGINKYAVKYNIPKFKNISEVGDFDYHNMYVQHAVQLGLAGLFLMLYLSYSLFALKFKSTYYRNINIAFATAFFLTSLLSNMLHSIIPMTFFGFFVAVLSAISRSEQQD